MSDRRGFLSQVVHDARPRSAPSLYAGGGMAPSATAPAPPVTYARLMGDSPKAESSGPGEQLPSPATPHVSTSDEDRFEGQQATARDTETVHAPFVATPTAKDILPDTTSPTAQVQGDTHTSAPVGSRAPQGVEASLNTSIAAHTLAPETFEALSADGPAIVNPNASPGHPQEAPPDSPLSTLKAPAVSISLPQIVERTVPHIEAEASGTGSTDNQTDSAMASAPSRTAQISAAEKHATQGPMPKASDVVPTPRHQAAVQTASTQQVAQTNAPTQVHIGQLEIVVQEPPAARAPSAPRPTPKAPSPARYHVRRF